MLILPLPLPPCTDVSILSADVFSDDVPTLSGALLILPLTLLPVAVLVAVVVLTLENSFGLFGGAGEC
jgi:hypothetical protein